MFPPSHLRIGHRFRRATLPPVPVRVPVRVPVIVIGVSLAALLLVGGAPSPEARVRTLLSEGRAGDAVAAANEILTVRPHDPEALLIAADANRANGNAGVAARMYSEAFETSGRLPPDRKAPKVFAAAANGLAVLRLQEGDAVGAVKILAFAYLHYPDDRDTLTNLGLGYSVLAEWDQAERFLKRVLDKAPGDLCATTLLEEVARLRIGGESKVIEVEAFELDGSAGRRAAWGVVVAVMARRSGPAGSGSLPPGVVLRGTVRDLEPALWVTLRAVRKADGRELATVDLRAPTAEALRERLPERLRALASALPK